MVSRTTVEAGTGDRGVSVDATSVYGQHRPRLFGIAYRMLGSIMEAEDVLQDAWLRWQSGGRDAAQNAEAWLTTVVTRLCIDHLRSARVRREQYVGVWLPEPIVTGGESAWAVPEDPRPTSTRPAPPAEAERGGAEPPDRTSAGIAADPAAAALLAESLSTAFLLILERLSPIERAAYLLREVFDYPYDEIAAFIDKSEANCRQLVSRARGRLAAGRPRFDTPHEAQARLAAGFARACSEGDVEGLVSLLAEDIVLWTDGGGKAQAAINPIYGPERVARFLFATASKLGDDALVRAAEINGAPGLLIYGNEALDSTLALHIEGERIQAVYIVRNPEKLVHIGRTERLPL